MSYSLRDLPLPVKVVASVFLMAVGVGYTSAMVQLHMQDAKSGKPMPTLDDVVFKYTGKRKLDGPLAAPASQLETLVMGPIEGAPWNGTGSMAPAFFHKDSTYTREIEANPADKARIDAERNGERELVRWWIRAAADSRKKMYQDDKCTIAPEKAPKQITSKFKDADGTFKIKTLIDTRCARCHSQDGSEAGYPLETYEQLEKYMAVASVGEAPQGGWVKVGTPIGLEKLTQSTHAHLLSFAMLFSLTGLIFAFTNYPTGMRCVLGPWVVLAVFADVSLWWLARLCDQWGPYFAMGIIGTGMVAGAGLFGQIVLSLFNMYGPKGKFVVGGLFVLGGVIAGLMWVNVFEPGLRAKASAQKPEEKAKDDKPTGTQTVAKKDEKTDDKKVEGKKDAAPRPPANDLDRLLTLPVRGADGQPIPPDQVQFNGSEKGSMVPAFFEKDKAYKKLLDDPTATQTAKDKLKTERQAELDATLAWARTAEAARKAAYDTDRFEVPPAVAGQVTSQFLKDGKVQIRSLIGARCAGCHAPEKKQEEWPLDTYEGLSKYLKPLAPDDPKGAAPAPVPAPVPAPAPKPADPIPDAKDD